MQGVFDTFEEVVHELRDQLRTREILDACAAAGTGYCLGTGNSVANYIPCENYLAMLDEVRLWNREHFGRA